MQNGTEERERRKFLRGNFLRAVKKAAGSPISKATAVDSSAWKTVKKAVLKSSNVLLRQRLLAENCHYFFYNGVHFVWIVGKNCLRLWCSINIRLRKLYV